ncbi:hypothetical protein BurJ1DRAFT_1675 [Burkholderiales bacterium JOSHI_001]|nr:hypothetical protein BurJ1DRAFT_1675 [Burkholderiales bacterium JOSHI_001]
MGLLGCVAAAPPPLVLPDWMQPALRWRQRLSAADNARLDRAMLDVLPGYHSRHGKVLQREFAVLRPQGVEQVLAAVDAALAAAGRPLVRQAVSGSQDGQQQWRWSADKAVPVVLVWLDPADPAQADRPGFVLLFEPGR